MKRGLWTPSDFAYWQMVWRAFWQPRHHHRKATHEIQHAASGNPAEARNGSGGRRTRVDPATTPGRSRPPRRSFPPQRAAPGASAAGSLNSKCCTARIRAMSTPAGLVPATPSGAGRQAGLHAYGRGFGCGERRLRAQVGLSGERGSVARATTCKRRLKSAAGSRM